MNVTVILAGIMIEQGPDGICPVVHVVETPNAPDRTAVNVSADEVLVVVVVVDAVCVVVVVVVVVNCVVADMDAVVVVLTVDPVVVIVAAVVDIGVVISS